MDVFRFQFQHNPVYRRFVHLMSSKDEVKQIEDIPFLPVSFFKTHDICTGFEVSRAWKTFLSSGTTGSQRSRHHLYQPEIYLHSLLQGFEHFYGPLDRYIILALVPTPLEQPQSSLVFMVSEMISRTKHPVSGFYLQRQNELQQVLGSSYAEKKLLLIGLSYALLDFVDDFPIAPSPLVVMETGGMKGRREKITREELHEKLCKAFRVQDIHSEYGMTELLSQAYSQGKGLFQTPPWMQIRIRDLDDPRKEAEDGKYGIIRIIDLANRHSCSFIETEDMGRKNADGSIEISGRADQSDARGCSLMI